MKRSWKRMDARASFLLACAGTVVAGCAIDNIRHPGKGLYPPANEVPIAANFPTTLQPKLQAADHWARVASDSAAELAKSLKPGVPLYLKRACETTACSPRACDTAFNQVFFNQLITALVRSGYPVTTVATVNATTVEVDAQAVSFAWNRPQYRYSGAAIEIGPGVWALDDVTGLLDGDGFAAPRTVLPEANWYRTEFAAGPTPRNELVVTVSAMAPNRVYLARSTRVYYTSDADAAHYFCASGLPAPVGSRQAAKTWSIPVQGDCTEPRCLQEAQGRKP